MDVCAVYGKTPAELRHSSVLALSGARETESIGVKEGDYLPISVVNLARQTGIHSSIYA
jgi:hypothetical protein